MGMDNQFCAFFIHVFELIVMEAKSYSHQDFDSSLLLSILCLPSFSSYSHYYSHIPNAPISSRNCTIFSNWNGYLNVSKVIFLKALEVKMPTRFSLSLVRTNELASPYSHKFMRVWRKTPL